MNSLKFIFIVLLIHLSYSKLAEPLGNFGSFEVQVKNISFEGNKTEIKSTDFLKTKIYIGIQGNLSDFSFVRLSMISLLKKKEFDYYCLISDPELLKCEFRTIPGEDFSGRLQVADISDWNDTFIIPENLPTLDVIGPQIGEKLIEKRIKSDYTFDLNGITDGEISNIYLCLEKDCPESERILCEKADDTLTNFIVSTDSQALLEKDKFYFGYISKNNDSYFIKNLFVIADEAEVLNVKVQEVSFDDGKKCFYNKATLLASKMAVSLDQSLTTTVPTYLQNINILIEKTTFIGYQCTYEAETPNKLSCSFSEENSLLNENTKLEYTLDSFIAKDEYSLSGIDFKFTFEPEYYLVDEKSEYVENKFTINGKGLRPTKVYLSEEDTISEAVNSVSCNPNYCEISKAVKDNLDKTKVYNIFYQVCSNIFLKLEGKTIQLVQNQVNITKVVYDETEDSCIRDSNKIPKNLILTFEKEMTNLGASFATLSTKKGIAAKYDCPALESSALTTTCTLNEAESQTSFSENSYDLTISSNEVLRDTYYIVPNFRTLLVQDELEFKTAEVYLKSNNLLKFDDFKGFLPKNIMLVGIDEPELYEFTCTTTVVDGKQNGECTCQDKIPEGDYIFVYSLCGYLYQKTDFVVHQPKQLEVSKYHFGSLNGTCFTSLDEGKPPKEFVLEFSTAIKLPASNVTIGSKGQNVFFYYTCPEVASAKIQTCTYDKTDGMIKDTATYKLISIETGDEKQVYSFESTTNIIYQIPIVSSTESQTIFLDPRNFMEFKFSISSGTYPRKVLLGSEDCTCIEKEQRCVVDDYLFRTSGDYNVFYPLCGKNTQIPGLHIILRADPFLVETYQMILGDLEDFMCFTDFERQNELKVDIPVEAPMTFPELTAKWTTEDSNFPEIEFTCPPVTQKSTIKCDIATEEKLKVGEYYLSEISGEGFPKDNFTITTSKAFTVGEHIRADSEKTVIEKMEDKKVNISILTGGFPKKIYLGELDEKISDNPPSLDCTEADKICTLSDKFNVTDGKYDTYYDVCQRKRKIDKFVVQVGNEISSGFELKSKISVLIFLGLLLL